MSFLRDLKDDESGFSLTELLTAMVVGSVILWALMQTMTTGFTKSVEITDRAETTQIGREASERIVTLLDSSVCLDQANGPTAVSPLVGSATGIKGSDDNYVAFYADLDGASDTPNKYTITYDPVADTLTEQRFDGAGTFPTVTFAATASQTRVLASNVVPARTSSNAQIPIFQYYKFTSTGAINSTPVVTPIVQASARDVVRIAFTFKVLSNRTQKEDGRTTTVEDQSSVGTPEPGTPAGGSCP
jgi:prepilin-type N-terminal cleavage/methylation domain-containing protein